MTMVSINWRGLSMVISFSITIEAIDTNVIYNIKVMNEEDINEIT